MTKDLEELVAKCDAVGTLVDDVLLAVASMEAPSSDVDPRLRTDDRLRELLVGLERVRNAAEAAQAGVLVALEAEARALDAAEFAAEGLPARSHIEFVPDEVGLLLAMTKRAASRRFGLALQASREVSLLHSWERGEMDAHKVQVIVDELNVLVDPEVAFALSDGELRALTSALAEAAAEYARTHTWSELRAWLRRRVLVMTPDIAELRRGRAERERRVQITPAEDGMSELWAWLLGPDQAPTVHLHVVAEPMGWADHEHDVAAWLTGVGPLTELQTDELMGAATRVVVDSAGRRPAAEGYRPSVALDREVRTRDVTCRFPGCRRSALEVGGGTDLDHTVPWPTGPTSASNLAALARRHHRLKHSPGWNVVLRGDGSMTWSSPSGRAFTTEPWHAANPPRCRVPAPREGVEPPEPPVRRPASDETAAARRALSRSGRRRSRRSLRRTCPSAPRFE